jgi:hypothetical protein
MPSQSREVMYGRASAESAGPSVEVRAGVPLRLSDGPYPFAEPPDLIGAATIAARLDLLREHLQTLCGAWDRLAQSFLDAYFARIATTLAAAAPELRALAARSGSIFAPEDWSFCALRPVPQAHLSSGDAAPVRVDFAFWTGAALVAIALEGSGLRKQRQAELERLAAAGVTLVRIPGATMREAALALPPLFDRFWDGVFLPASPFGAEALMEIRQA